ncbi:response regulator transcription factor [Mucilaginibacter ginsenosidivorax]|uniref:Response regulator transcription factor n=1 Tax=Mucilaginibacter ginsenosidivorax TaxID=862126 RepID=A0A5B8VX80_9SPHI|nr:response regulator transcription factor [Mucilaginibacter ginsenosidivorax]QEC76177.1 response regulator transcription factor [Mucilaginibacter ginsenosidivorax]
MTPAKPAIQIIIAEDHPTFSIGVEQSLARAGNLKVIDKVTNGKQLLQLLNTKVPHLILMDILMPYMNGIEAAKQIRKDFPAIRIIFISMYEERNIIKQCMQYGHGYIPKASTTEQLITIINTVMAGQTYYHNNRQQPFQQTYSDDLIKKYKLTKREIELIQLLKNGLTTKEIAGKLFLSSLTIETHRKNIFRKLEVKNITELIVFALSNRIVE